MTYRKINVIPFLLLLLTFHISQAQQSLPTIACICELEALIIKSKETDKELILEETEAGFTYEFVPKQIEVPKQELKLVNIEKEVNINTKDEPLQIKKDLSKRKLKKKRDKSRKRRKDKKVKLKRKIFKKYKGDCPRW
jgi:hypothetical protein